MTRFVAMLVIALVAAACRDDQDNEGNNRAHDGSGSAAEIVMYPEKTDPDCRTGRARLYDECSDQISLFDQALARANRDGKVLLVSYGAEWCIWCHVFAQYVHGVSGAFTYEFSGPEEPDARHRATLYERASGDVSRDVRALSEFVSKSFIIVHIDAQFAPNGQEVVHRSGAAPYYTGGIPYIFAVDADGRYAERLLPKKVETRRDTADWYRGYDRNRLLAALKVMYAAGKKSDG